MEGGVETQRSACEECTRKCFQTHGKRLKSSNSDQISFFKVMIGSYESTLIIPPVVRLVLESLANETVYIEDLDGCFWEVKLSIVNNSLAFEEGWNHFVSAHEIECGEFLIFKYIGQSKFIVQIFSRSGRERLNFLGNNKSNPLRKKNKIDSGKDHLHKHKRPFGKLKDKFRSTRRDLVNRKKEGSNATNDYQKQSMELVDDCPQLNKHEKKPDPLGDKCCTPVIDCPQLNKSEKKPDPLGDKCCTPVVDCPQLNKCKKNPDQLGDKCCMPVVDHPRKDGKTVEASNKKREFIPIDFSDGKKAGITPFSDFKKPKKESVDDHLDLKNCGKTFILSREKCYFTPVDQTEREKIGTAAANGVKMQDTIKTHCVGPGSTGNIKSSSMNVANCGSRLINEHCSVNKKTHAFHSVSSPKNLIDNDFMRKQNNRMTSLEPPNSNAPEMSDQQGCHSVLIKEFRRADNDKMIAPTTYPHSVEGCRTKLHEIAHHDSDASKQSRLSSPLIDLDDIETVDNGEKYEESKKLAVARQESPCFKDNSIKLTTSHESVCTGHELKDSIALIEGNCNIHLPACSVLGRKSDLDPDPSNMYPINMEDLDIDARKYKTNNSFLIKETLLQNLQDKKQVDKDTISKSDCDRDYNHFSDVTAKHQCIVGMKFVGSSGNYRGVFPKMADDSCIEKNISQETVSDTGQHQRPDIISGSGNLSALEEREKKDHPLLNGLACAAVKTEVVEAAELSLPVPVKLSFRVAAISQPWHELPESLPSKRKKNERKVIFLRDIFKKVWPILYHESERFIGFLGGWLAFALAHNLREGDVCILEMVNESEALFEVLISRK